MSWSGLQGQREPIQDGAWLEKEIASPLPPYFPHAIYVQSSSYSLEWSERIPKYPEPPTLHNEHSNHHALLGDKQRAKFRPTFKIVIRQWTCKQVEEFKGGTPMEPKHWGTNAKGPGSLSCLLASSYGSFFMALTLSTREIQQKWNQTRLDPFEVELRKVK